VSGRSMLTVADTNVPVVVLTVSANPLLHGSLNLARSLGRLGVAVHVLHPRAWTPTDHSRYLADKTVVSFDDEAPKRLLDDLLEAGRRIGRRAILIPLDDRATLFVGDHAAALREWFIFPDQDPSLSRRLANKWELHQLCRQLGLPAAQTERPRSRAEVEAFAATASFPVVVKAIDPFLLARRAAAKSVVIVADGGELLEAYDQMEDPEQPNLMLQEYIPGGADSIWMFNGYFNRDSDCLAAFTGVKLRQCPPHTGATSLGVCRHNPTVEQQTRRLFKEIGYQGIVDLGYRYDARDGQYKLLDVNPRIGATFRLFVGGNGLDVARALYLDLTGQPVPPARARDGRRWLVEHNDLLASVRYWRRGELSPGAWLGSFRGVREGAWFAWDDPVPFATMCWWSLRLALGRGQGR
jgi:D-aspartate ligase